MMHNEPRSASHTVEQFVNLEQKVWEAFVLGDPTKDAEMLSDDFVGVYTTGIWNKLQHCKQLEDGPVVAKYELRNPIIQPRPNGSVMLIYSATYTPLKYGKVEAERKMYVSSLWENHAGRWLNVFSQDTPEAG